MTVKIKPSVAGSLMMICLGLLGLYGSVVKAAPEVSNLPLNETSVNHLTITLSTASTLTNHYDYPSLTNDFFNQTSRVSAVTWTNSSRQPLRGIQIAEFSHLTPNKYPKSHSFFEFAAKFNDKLQQILAYFDFSSKSTNNTEENINNEQAEQEISISNQASQNYASSNCPNNHT